MKILFKLLCKIGIHRYFWWNSKAPYCVTYKCFYCGKEKETINENGGCKVFRPSARVIITLYDQDGNLLTNK